MKEKNNIEAFYSLIAIIGIVLMAFVTAMWASPVVENKKSIVKNNIVRAGEDLVITHSWDKNRQCKVKDITDVYNNISTGDFKQFKLIDSGKVNKEYGSTVLLADKGKNYNIEFRFLIPTTWNPGPWVGQRKVEYYSTCTYNPFVSRTEFNFPRYNFTVKPER